MQNFIKTVVNALQLLIQKHIKASVADWNENDSSAANYVKNRTHWEENEKTVLVDGLTFEDYNSGYAPSCSFIPGQKYTVIWNGVTYNDLICEFDGDYNVIASFDKGQNFYIDDDGGNGLFIESEEEDYIVSIIQTEVIIHKIDSKYIPDSVATIDDVQVVVDAKVDETVDDVYAAMATKMDVNSPVGYGSFSMNRKANSEIGVYSSTIGSNSVASATSSFASGTGNVSNFANLTVSGEYNLSPPTSERITKDKRLSGLGPYIGVCYADLYSIVNGEYVLENGTLADLQDIPVGCYFLTNWRGGTYSQQSSKYLFYCKDIIDDYRIDIVYDEYFMASENGDELGEFSHIVGNGTSDESRSNSHTLDWHGNAWFAGDVYIGSESGVNRDAGSKKLATEEHVASKYALKEEIVNIDLSAYETSENAQAKFDEAKEYADAAAQQVKNDLLNGAGEAFDTLGELAVLIDENHDALDALETIANNKADASDVKELQQGIDSISGAVEQKSQVQFITWGADD